MGGRATTTARVCYNLTKNLDILVKLDTHVFGDLTISALQMGKI